MPEGLMPSPKEMGMEEPPRRNKIDLRRTAFRVTAAAALYAGLTGAGGQLERAEAAPAPKAKVVAEVSPEQAQLMQERAIQVGSATYVFRAFHPEAVKTTVDDKGIKHETFEGNFQPHEDLADLVQVSPSLSGEVVKHKNEGKSFKETYRAKVEAAKAAIVKAKNISADAKAMINQIITVGLGRIFGLSAGTMEEPQMIGGQEMSRIETAGDLAFVVSESAKELDANMAGTGIDQKTEGQIEQNFIRDGAEVGLAGVQENMLK